MKLTAALAALLLASIPAISAAAPAQAHAVSGAHVLELTRQYLAAAPHRALGTPGHAAAEKFIREHFGPEAAKGNFVADSFSAHTPAGQLPMTNFIVKFPAANAARRDSVIVLASHYETNYPLQNINFVGANDGACTSALLIALGEYFRAHPPQNASVWLLFTDGEEAVQQWSASDSLYGSRHLAAKWSADGTITHIKAFLLADMIGYKDLNIDKDMNSTPWLLDLLAKAARETGHASAVFRNTTQVEDDHLPFKVRGVPVLDIIDLDYGPPTQEHPEGGFHHTDKDTIDKLSAGALQTSADLFLQMVRLVEQH